MKQKYHEPFCQWPALTFKEIENIEIENKNVKTFYESFFAVLRVPELTLKAFYDLLRQDLKEN